MARERTAYPGNNAQRRGSRLKALGMAVYELCKETVTGYLNDDPLSQGAAIAFYAVTSMAPLLLVVSGVASLAFGADAARGALVSQLSGVAGVQSAEFFQSIIQSASARSSGLIPSLLGTLTLVVTISGVFGEMQSALNAIWKVKAVDTTVSRLIRARAASFGLVVALGFLLMTSLAVSAGLAAFGEYLKVVLPVFGFVLPALNFVTSLLLIAVLFGAIFKVLPDRTLQWKDVVIGGASSALLFSFGKFLIAAYLATSGIATTYGAAGALILLLLWIYYSVQTLLLGAEFTKAYAHQFGSRKNKPALRMKAVEI